MKLLVGLGNPGEKYEKTRHNLGFMVVEKFLKDVSSVVNTDFKDEKKLKSQIAVVDWQPKSGKAERIILAKPQTYMNNSGIAVRLIADFYKIAPEDIWIAYDDLDIKVGSIKIRFGGAAGGHHGVESILSHLQTDSFWRFRFGIGIQHEHSRKAKGSVEEYVLGTFGTTDHNKIREMIKHGSQAIEIALEKGLETAQNRFNV